MEERLISDSTPFAALTVGQAEKFIVAIVSRALGTESKKEIVKKSEQELYGMEEAAQYLRDRGMCMTKKTLYEITFRNKISYKKVGKRNLFSRENLDEYVEHNTRHKGSDKSDATLRIAQSINRKG